MRQHLWDKKKIFEWRPSFSCYGVIQFHIVDQAARDFLRQYWPDNRPHFWTRGGAEISQILDHLRPLNGGKGPLVDAHYFREYFIYYEYGGFSTRSGGGRIDHKGFPAKFFPYRIDEGLPWISPALSTAPTIYRDIDLDNGANSGFLYCYPIFAPGARVTEAHVPGYFQRTFSTRVDGETVDLERAGPTLPSPIFERDEYIYYEFHVSLT